MINQDDDELREFTRSLFNTTDNRVTLRTDSTPSDHHKEILDYFKALTESRQTTNQKDTTC